MIKIPKLINWKQTGYREWKNIFGEKLKVKTVKRGAYTVEFKGILIQKYPYQRITEALNAAVNFMRKWNKMRV